MSAHGTPQLAIPADHLQSLLSASVNPTLVLRYLNDELTIVGGNDKWVGLCGTDLRELMRRSPGICMSAELATAIGEIARAASDSEPAPIAPTPAHTVGTTMVHVTVVLTAPEGTQQFLLVYAEAIADERDPQAEAVLATMPEPLVLIDHEYAITYTNGAVEQLLGWTSQHLLATDVRALAYPESVDDLVAQLVSATGNTSTTRLKFATRSNKPCAVEVSARLMPNDDQQIIITLHDLTHQQLHEEALADLSTTDPLTGLANRQTFSDRINDIATSGREREVTVAFLDLDNFKTINDALGHDHGDAVLRTIAKTTRSCCRLVRAALAIWWRRIRRRHRGRPRHRPCRTRVPVGPGIRRPGGTRRQGAEDHRQHRHSRDDRPPPR